MKGVTTDERSAMIEMSDEDKVGVGAKTQVGGVKSRYTGGTTPTPQ